MNYQNTDLKEMNDMKHRTVLNKLSALHIEILLCVLHFNLFIALWPLAPAGEKHM